MSCNQWFIMEWKLIFEWQRQVLTLVQGTGTWNSPCLLSYTWVKIITQMSYYYCRETILGSWWGRSTVYSKNWGEGGGTDPSARVGWSGSCSSKTMFLSSFDLQTDPPPRRALSILTPRPTTSHWMGDLGEGLTQANNPCMRLWGLDSSTTHNEYSHIVVRGGDFGSACRGLNNALLFLSLVSLDSQLNFSLLQCCCLLDSGTGSTLPILLWMRINVGRAQHHVRHAVNTLHTLTIIVTC